MKTYSNKNKKNVYKIFSLNKISDGKKKNCDSTAYICTISCRAKDVEIYVTIERTG